MDSSISAQTIWATSSVPVDIENIPLLVDTAATPAAQSTYVLDPPSWIIAGNNREQTGISDFNSFTTSAAADSVSTDTADISQPSLSITAPVSTITTSPSQDGFSGYVIVSNSTIVMSGGSTTASASSSGQLVTSTAAGVNSSNSASSVSRMSRKNCALAIALTALTIAGNILA